MAKHLQYRGTGDRHILKTQTATYHFALDCSSGACTCPAGRAATYTIDGRAILRLYAETDGTCVTLTNTYDSGAFSQTVTQTSDCNWESPYVLIDAGGPVYYQIRMALVALTCKWVVTVEFATSNDGMGDMNGIAIAGAGDAHTVLPDDASNTYADYNGACDPATAWMVDVKVDFTGVDVTP